MELFFTVLESTALLCLLLIPGFFIKKLRLGEGEFGKGLSNVILYIAQPCLFIVPYVRDFDIKILANMGITLLASIAIHGIGLFWSVLFFKNMKDKTDVVLRIAVIFANCGYMGIPLVKMIFGSEMAIYGTVYNIGFQFYLWTLGWYFASGDKKYMSVKKMFINPAMISIYIGLLFFFLPINRFMPDVVLSTMNTLQDLVVPLSMMLVGYHMASNKLSTIFVGKKMWFAILLKLVVIPFVTFCILKLILIAGVPLDKSLASVFLILSATPCASVTSVLTEKFDLDRETVGKLIPLSTILCIATLPVFAMLTNYL